MQLARVLKDRAVEAQACYSLGNTYTLLQDYERAIDYHLKHLIIAQDLSDRYTTESLLLLSALLPNCPQKCNQIVHLTCGWPLWC